MKKRRGIALITVLLVSVVVFIMVMVGLGVTGRNLLFVSSVHQRNRALCAAEAGVYALMAKLDSTPTFSGTLQGSLQDGASYTVTFTRSGSQMEIYSTGLVNGVQRKLQTTVALSGDAFLGLSSEGYIQSDGNNYLNGILSTANPLAQRGNLHTNFNGNPAFHTSGNISTTGTLSTVGTITGNVDGDKKPNSPPLQLSTLDKNTLTSGTFRDGTVPSGGLVASNLRINSDLQADQPIVLRDGATLYVKGDAVFKQGISGQGTVVSDGMVLVRGSNSVDMTNTKGVTIYASQDLVVAHPNVTFDSNGNYQSTPDPIGDYFAGMPEDVPYILNQRLPVDAPTGVDFFTWYKTQTANPSPEFIAWRDGNGSELNPGLPDKVKTWLNNSVQLEPQLRQWAGN